MRYASSLLRNGRLRGRHQHAAFEQRAQGRVDLRVGHGDHVEHPRERESRGDEVDLRPHDPAYQWSNGRTHYEVKPYGWTQDAP